MPYEYDIDDKVKETEIVVTTEKYDYNEKLGTTTNDYGVRRSTRRKSQRTPYV